MTLKRIISIPLIFFVVVSVMSTFAQENDDYNALVAFYNSTNGDDWAENTDWLVDPNVCNWFGITCDIEGKVISIDFKPTLDNSGTFISTDIIGSIPPEIGDLVYLEELIIWNADF